MHTMTLHSIKLLLLQACLPGLHISLGIFYRLFSLLEDEVHLLDFQAATLTTPQAKRNRLQLKANLYDQLCTTMAINIAAPNPLLSAVIQEAANLRTKIQDIVRCNSVYDYIE